MCKLSVPKNFFPCENNAEDTGIHARSLLANRAYSTMGLFGKADQIIVIDPNDGLGSYSI